MKIRLGLPVLLFGLLCGVSITALASEDERILRELTARAYLIESIDSKFTQTRHISFLDEDLVSKGSFLFSHPDNLIWQYEEPQLFRLEYIAGKARFQHDLHSAKPDGEQGAGSREETIARAISEQIMLWISLDMNAINKAFKIEIEQKTPLVLALTPRKKSPVVNINAIRMEFADNNLDVRRIVLTEEDGDYTRLDFYETKRTGGQ